MNLQPPYPAIVRESRSRRHTRLLIERHEPVIIGVHRDLIHGRDRAIGLAGGLSVLRRLGVPVMEPE